jgi:anti-anti-sigma factor
MHGWGLDVEELGEGTVLLAPHGELDLAHAYVFDEQLRRVERGGPRCVVIDLRQLNFLDSCGLSRLLAARRRARRAGHRLVLVRGPAAVQRLLAAAALDDVFELVSDPPRGVPA